MPPRWQQQYPAPVSGGFRGFPKMVSLARIRKEGGIAGARRQYLLCRLSILRNIAVQPKLHPGAIKRWGGYKK
jgi:hypothetical protein